jgi:hypothetical protein
MSLPGNFEKTDLSQADMKVLAAHELNGRQVKNIVRMAITYAGMKGRRAGLDDLLMIIKRVQSFKRDQEK